MRLCRSVEMDSIPWGYFPNRRRQNEETTFMTFLLGRFVEECESTRAVSSSWRERDDAVPFIKGLLQNESDPPALRNFELETALTKEGIITRPRGVLQFSTPIVRSVVIKMLFNDEKTSLPADTTSLSMELRNFDFFLNSCLKRMMKRCVCNEISEGVDGKIYERAFQMEFYRVAVPLVDLIGGVCCPDAGAVFNSRGFLDFYVNRKLQWAFELTRNNSRLDEHLSRFCRSTGTYRFIPINKWAVVNFVQCLKRITKPRDVKDGEVRVMFLKSDGKFKVYRKEGTKILCTEGCFAN